MSLPNPRIEWLGGQQFWLMEEFRIQVLGRTLVLPEGFVCDGASVPRPFWGGISPLDCGEVAPLVHDWLYRTGGDYGRFTREEADKVFLQHMAAAGVPWWRRYPAYLAVRAAGGKAWRKDAVRPPQGMV